jgi:uncharacterized membrane protein YfcA
VSWLWLSVASFLAGLLGSMGMGGGGILVIFLALYTQLPQATVQGINLLFFIPIAVFSVIIYQKDRLIKWRVVIPFTAVGVFASVFGAHLSNSIDDIWLRRGFGVLLLIMGLRELFSKKK